LPGVIRVTLFSADGSARRGGEELVAAAPPPGGAIWIDFQGPDKRIEPWLREWGFHPLAIEDVFTLDHQPKVEDYAGTIFVIVRGLDFAAMKDRPAPEILTLKLAAFLEKSRLVTLHRAPMRSVQTILDRLAESGRALPGGVAQVLWSICDEMMDHYMPVIEELSERIEEIEERVVAHPTEAELTAVLDMRRRLSALRRTMLPHRQVFGHLANSRTGAIDDVAGLNFRDTQDNVLRLADALEQQGEMLNNVKDTYLSIVAQRTNDIMRVLTVFSAIVLPLSLIASIYGMNFRHMPELERPWGYPVVLGGMVALAVGMLAWFRRKRWI
jgi:magnesium transporter